MSLTMKSLVNIDTFIVLHEQHIQNLGWSTVNILCLSRRYALEIYSILMPWRLSGTLMPYFHHLS